ncbi:GNAT family N-acetyltransferase [Heyndrickxia oleronia]|jgi:RimJ/RimL family protein N-acetyltransferase|uniref:GNAT family N-acetyltransferase n=1 Tax=Heyndrickxia oleronia TaxID=38875 RepID=UPI00217E8580|nr:GNAT family protein [Heyndrickxia oleronia]MCI1593646.1 GNAT family N-acetyltransferase [Heyndrickxia oleronia]MCI1615943.1 GNAT family N-acetyltransferase [Heyndrickxia oleronia]MCI1746007.1 GNAT family N-acetyltransferase [Heyndrickxia oleronia]MCI1763947.1 GNAT family N-acetyltransferase [Heyndrickxia oleronia]
MKTTELPKVYLRELTLNDVEDRFRWCLDKEVTKHLNMPEKYPPFSKEETKSWIKMCINKTNGYEQKAIETEEGRHIGWIDLKNIDKLNKHAELGVAIGDKTYWGKGYGFSAMKEMLQWGFNELDLNKIWLRVEVDNEKAIKSYKRIGYVEEGILRQDRLRNGEFVDRLRMSILRHEFFC